MKFADFSPAAVPSLDQQRDALRKGLGRAFLWAQQGQLDVDLLLDACLHDWRFDRGFEIVREDWLWQMMTLDDRKLHFRPALLEALQQLSDEEHAAQLCMLAYHYAQGGDREFRTRLYEIVESKPYPESTWLAEEQIIQLDAEEGFLFAVRLRGRELSERQWQWEDAHLASAATKHLGEQRTEEALQTETDAAVRRFRAGWLEEKRQSQDGHGASWAEEMRRINVSDIIHAAESATECNSFFRYWGVHASEADLESVLQRLLLVSDAATLAKYLFVFHVRGFPRFEPQLLELCQHSDDDVRRAAFVALEKTPHPGIRDFALAELRKGLRDDTLISLFVNNYAPGDEEQILEFLEIPEDEERLHHMLMKVIDVLANNEQADCTHLGVTTYALTPCSFCRFSAAQLLLKRHAAPPWLIEEGRHDVEHDTRKLFEGV